MTNPTIRPGGTLWRLLVLDRSDPDDAKWLLVSVALPQDVLAAKLDEIGGYRNWREVTDWVRATTGQEVRLVPVVAPLVWRVDEGGPR